MFTEVIIMIGIHQKTLFARNILADKYVSFDLEKSNWCVAISIAANELMNFHFSFDNVSDGGTKYIDSYSCLFVFVFSNF